MTTDDLDSSAVAAPDADALDDRKRYQKRATVMIVALAVASIAFRLLYAGGLRHSAAVFVGIPTMIALLVVNMEKPATGTGVVMRVITLALLLSGIVFAEGFICIVLAAPIFYLVGFVAAKAVGGMMQAGRHGRGAMMLMLVLLPTGLEGTMPGVEWNREERVTRSLVVRATPAQVRAALATRPDFAAPLPPFLRLRFPVPVATSGSGLAVGDTRAVVFEHAHGGHIEHGTLMFRVAESDSAAVRFEPVRDDSYITHWLSWESSDVQWQAISAHETRVAWTLTYRRRLDPAWYFAPLERYGVGVAAGYLIEALAVPSAHLTPMPVADSSVTEHHHGS